MRWVSKILLIVALVVLVQALPSEIVEDVDDHAEIVELPSLRRSLGERKFKIKAFGKQLNLDLVKTQGLMPEVINVKFIGSDEDGNQTIDDWSHLAEPGQDFYSDINNRAFLMIDEISGKPKLNGMLSEDVVIEWYEEEETTPNTLQHKVYKVKRLHDQVVDSEEKVDRKRQVNGFFTGGFQGQQAANLYIGINVVLDYKLFVKSGMNQANSIAYAKTFIGSVNSLYAQLTAPRVQLILQGITVLTSAQQSPTDVYRQHHAGNALHGNPLHFSLNSQWVAQNIGLFGSNIGSIIYLSGFFEMCGEKDTSGRCAGTRGLAQIGSVCNAFPQDGREWRLALVLDDFGYGGYKAAAHELGHQLGMSHDGERTALYAKYGMPTSIACASRQGIMASTLGEQQSFYQWSQCSKAQLTWWASQPGSACAKSPQTAKQQMSLPNVSADTQCKLRNGNNYKASTADASICYKLQCVNQLGQRGFNSFYTGAAPGTPCGNGGQCKDGSCVRGGGVVNSGNQANGGNVVMGGNVGGTVSQACSDSHQSCLSWAAAGECNKNPTYMLVNCKRSCRQCMNSAAPSGGSSTCVDSNQNCARWAAGNACSTSAAYMLTNCKKSCRQCFATGNGGVVG